MAIQAAIGVLGPAWIASIAMEDAAKHAAAKPTMQTNVDSVVTNAPPTPPAPRPGATKP
jgi:hypothetical protein